MSEVARVRTATDELSMAAILRDAYAYVFGEPITLSCLGVACSQCFLENGHGSAIDCYNYGNITAAHDWPGDYYVIHFAPGTNPTDPPTMNFRAFSDHVDGARAYFAYLQVHQEGALSQFEAGNPDEAAKALKAGRYFTASLDSYERAMVSLYVYAQKHVLPLL